MIKFDSQNLPAFVRTEILTDSPHPSGLTYGYFMNTSTGSDRVQDGDYIDDEKMVIYKPADITPFIKTLLNEKIGKQVVRDLYQTLQNQNLTQTQEGDLINRIYPVLGSLGDGFIRGARVIANNLTVAGQLTQARKDYLIGKIDEAITKL